LQQSALTELPQPLLPPLVACFEQFVQEFSLQGVYFCFLEVRPLELQPLFFLQEHYLPLVLLLQPHQLVVQHLVVAFVLHLWHFRALDIIVELL